MNTLKFFTAVLALLGLLTMQSARADDQRAEDRHAESLRAEEEAGTVEHYHHEFYSHSYVDSNYRNDEDSLSKATSSKSKTGRYAKTKKTNTDVSIAFGGHRTPHQNQK